MAFLGRRCHARAQRGRTVPELACRTGYGVEILWRAYARCLGGHKQLPNRCTEQAMDEHEDPGTD